MEKLHSDLSDPELMAKLDQNDVDAWSELIHRYNKIAYSIAYQILRNQHDAEDAMQNTFVRLKIYASKFDKSQPLQPWLSRIAGAEAIRIYQKKKLKNKRESIRMDAIKIQPQSPKSDASARLEKSEANHLLHTAMNQLPDASRIALTLYYGSGLSQTEIAQQLGVSQVRVSERIKSGIEKLKIFLKKSGLTSIAFSSITFHQYCLALSPSPQFTERLASKLPNDTLIKSILNADVKPKRMASKSFFNATTIKWGIFFSLFCLASFLWINFKPKENIPATATTTTALPVATTTPIAEEKPNVLEWHKATLEDVTIFHYKPGMIQEKIEDPNKLVEGNILFTGNNGNWSFKVDDKQNTIFSRKTNDKKTRDGIHSKTFTEPHCFAGSIQFSVNDSLIELTMGS